MIPVIKKIASVIFLFCIFSVLLTAAKNEAINGLFLKNTYVVLPSSSKIVFSWLSMPLDPEKVKPVMETGMKMHVDDKSRLWVVNDGGLVNTLLGLTVRPDYAIVDAVFLDNGALFLTTEKYLGSMIMPGKKEFKSLDGSVAVRFQPLAGLPAAGCRVFKGSSDVVYLCGQNAATGEYEVYTFGGSESLKMLDVDGMKQKAAAIYFNKVYSSKKPVTCAAGNGKTTYIASGRLVIEVKKGNEKAAGFFTHPSRDITSLAYSEEAGLFYTTDTGIGYAARGIAYEFMKTPNSRIQIGKRGLYIFLLENYGVLMAGNVDEFKNGNGEKNK